MTNSAEHDGDYSALGDGDWFNLDRLGVVISFLLIGGYLCDLHVGGPLHGVIAGLPTAWLLVVSVLYTGTAAFLGCHLLYEAPVPLGRKPDETDMTSYSPYSHTRVSKSLCGPEGGCFQVMKVPVAYIRTDMEGAEYASMLIALFGALGFFSNVYAILKTAASSQLYAMLLAFNFCVPNLGSLQWRIFSGLKETYFRKLPSKGFMQDRSILTPLTAWSLVIKTMAVVKSGWWNPSKDLLAFFTVFVMGVLFKLASGLPGCIVATTSLCEPWDFRDFYKFTKSMSQLDAMSKYLPGLMPIGLALGLASLLPTLGAWRLAFLMTIILLIGALVSAIKFGGYHSENSKAFFAVVSMDILFWPTLLWDQTPQLSLPITALLSTSTLGAMFVFLSETKALTVPTLVILMALGLQLLLIVLLIMKEKNLECISISAKLLQPVASTPAGKEKYMNLVCQALKVCAPDSGKNAISKAQEERAAAQAEAKEREREAAVRAAVERALGKADADDSIFASLMNDRNQATM